MMADMSALSSKIDAYSHRLSYFELSEVLRMLRQNVQPVDYEPLILSPNRNLRMLGLSVVWRFGIEDAEEILLRIVAENRSEESVGAMYVLCTLHSVITRPEVEKFVGGMNPFSAGYCCVILPGRDTPRTLCRYSFLKRRSDIMCRWSIRIN